MAKGPAGSGEEPRKPRAGARKKSASLAPAQHDPVPPKAAKEPSAMYKLFTRGRNYS